MYQSSRSTSIRVLRISGLKCNSIRSRVARLCKLAHNNGAPIPLIIESDRQKSIMRKHSYKMVNEKKHAIHVDLQP